MPDMSSMGRQKTPLRPSGRSSDLEPEDRARLLAAIVDNSTDLIAIADLEGNVTFLNPAAVAVLGQVPDEVGGQVRDYYAPDEWARIEGEVFPALEQHGHWEGPATVRHLETGDPIEVDMTVFRVDDPETGRPLGVATIQRNVSRRVQAQERSYVAQLGELADAAVAISSRVSVPDILEELRRQAVPIVRASWAAVDLDARDPGRDAGIATELAIPLVGGDGQAFAVLRLGRPHPFTERDRNLLVQLAQIAAVAVEKAELYEVTAEQEAIRYREEMMAGVSHDMQTPLAAILGFADMLSSGDSDVTEEERAEIYATLARQAQNLHVQVQRFLDYSVLEADRDLIVHRRRIDVERVIERVVALFQHQREIIVGVEDGLPPAAGDGERVEQVLTNLVSNAVKYSEEPIRVVAREQLRHIVIDVVDEGRGMDDETLSNLFRKFHRGSNVEGTPGTGLGLYVSKALVEAQGGSLTATSVPGMGSRFRISLPLASAGR